MEKLKPVVEFAKAHKFELICAGAALVVFGGLWWYLPSVTEEVKKSAMDRLVVKQGVEAVAKMPTVIDGLTYTGDVKNLTPTDRLIALKATANTQMTNAKTELLKKAQEENQKGRVGMYEKTLEAQFITTGASEILEKVDKVSIGRRYLGDGSMAADTYTFLDKHYRYMFDQMALKLTGSSTDPKAGVVPSYATLETAYKKDRDDKLSKIPDSFKETKVDAALAAARDAAARDDFIRTEIQKIANSVMVYIDPEDSLHRRTILSNAGGSNVLKAAPTTKEVFEAYVDNWIEWDVVNAVFKTNDFYGAKPSLGVTKSAIKRVVRVITGPGAMTPFGPGGGDNATLAQGADGLFLKPSAPAGPAAPDLAFSVTGHVEDGEYHMVPVCITIVCEPSKVGKFIENLYLANNGYTVLARKDTMIDPYAAASAGYLYGNQQCIQVELLVECAMFRTWLDQVMPK